MATARRYSAGQRRPPRSGKSANCASPPRTAHHPGRRVASQTAHPAPPDTTEYLVSYGSWSRVTVRLMRSERHDRVGSIRPCHPQAGHRRSWIRWRCPHRTRAASRCRPDRGRRASRSGGVAAPPIACSLTPARCGASWRSRTGHGRVAGAAWAGCSMVRSSSPQRALSSSNITAAPVASLPRLFWSSWKRRGPSG